MNACIGPMNVLLEHITVSGFSSGGTFAQILQIAHSAVVKGTAVFSHSEWTCPTVSPYETVARDSVNCQALSHANVVTFRLRRIINDKFQLKVAWILAFYRCGPPNGKFEDWDRVCTQLHNTSQSELYDPKLVDGDVQDYFIQGLIDDPNCLKNARLYVYAGLRNVVFSPSTQSMELCSKKL